MDKSLCVEKKQVDSVVSGLIKLLDMRNNKSLSSALEPEAINLQLTFKKIPNVRNKIIKIPIPTPVVQETTDVCLFVKDEDKKERDYAPTVRRYKDLLAANGIKRHIDVIPLKSVKLEYQPYEAKRNLSNMYDVFLADERIVRLLPRLLGKHFIARKRFPIQVNLTAKDLKKEINKALSNQQCILSGKGSTCQVTVAHTKMPHAAIVKNVEAAMEKLSNDIPGGAGNVRSLNLKTHNSPALPLFVSLGDREDIEVPLRKGYNCTLEPEEVTTVPNALVKITRQGRIKVVPCPSLGDLQCEENDDDEDPEAETPKSKETKKRKKRVREDDSDDDLSDLLDHDTETQPKRKRRATKVNKEMKAKEAKKPVKKSIELTTDTAESSTKKGLKRAKDVDPPAKKQKLKTSKKSEAMKASGLKGKTKGLPRQAKRKRTS